MNRRAHLLLLSVLIGGLAAGGCAASRPSAKSEPDRLPYRSTPQGTIIYGEEFEFSPPPPEWRLVRVQDPGGTGQEGEFSFAFFRSEAGPSPSQSVFAYDEEPFGYSRDLETRAREHLKRFLWGAILQFQTLEQAKIPVLGGEGLAVVVEGKDPVKGEKVLAKIVFGKRGDRVVSFYITQWRPMGVFYDLSAFSTFDAFVRSFRFVKKSFYETL